VAVVTRRAPSATGRRSAADPVRTGSTAAGRARRRLPIDDSLFFKLVRVVNLTARPFVEGLSRAHRLSLNEWRAMVVVASHPGVVAREVADLTGLDKMSVSRALAALDRDGRVARHPDPADARRACLHLTAVGERLFQTIGEQAVERERQLYSGLAARERADLMATIDRLIESLRAGEPAPAAGPAAGRTRRKTGPRSA
jgi:DNA-binding MarR family transcriptional regulator